MSSTATDRNRLEAMPSDQFFVWSSRLAAGLALLSFLLVLSQLITRTPVLGQIGRAEALLVITTALSTLLVQAKQLPGHKVLFSAAIVAVGGGGIHALGS